LVQAAPSAAHCAVIPPHLPALQSSLQQSLDVEHDEPSERHEGATHTPPMQLPLQQLDPSWQAPPALVHIDELA
jgi:hypothetical protein